MSSLDRQNILFCFCGPGASGKSTLSRLLIEEDKGIRLSISTTTRKPRGEEQDGKEYFFVSEEEFQLRVAADKFIEHATFANKHYGTEHSNVDQAEKEKKDIFFDIDVQGAEQLKAKFPGRVVTIFVFPPSFSVLRERFQARGEDSPERIEERLQIAKREVALLSRPGFSDYFILNDSLESSLAACRSIIKAERLRFSRLALKNLFD